MELRSSRLRCVPLAGLLMALALGPLAGCATGSTHDAFALKAEGPLALPAGATTPMTGTPVSLPAAPSGMQFIAPRTLSSGGATITYAAYVTPGPAIGDHRIVAAEITVAVLQDQASHASLATGQDMSAAAKAIRNAGPAPVAFSVGRHVGLYWSRQDVLPAVSGGVPEQVSSMYEFPSSGNYVVQVHATNLAKAVADGFVAGIAA